MRKYYMSFVDFSEIINVSADETQLTAARERMTELGLLTEKGNPSPAQIAAMVEDVSAPFFEKLERRIRRRTGGILAVKRTLQKLYDKKEYTAVFLYLCFLYGFMEWQVPERVRLMPALPETLKLFTADFMDAFESYILHIEQDPSNGCGSDGEQETA